MVTFHDLSKQAEVVDDLPPINTMYDLTPNVDLQDFLRRPVRIGTFTWAETDAALTSHTFSPWHLFFNDARIKYKLNNYSFLRCNLKVKVVINASPFYYGAMIASYQPLPGFTPSRIIGGTASKDTILYSQRPSFWIYPQTNQGGEITLPFFYHKNWLQLQTAQNFTDMGTLTLYNYTTLQSANGATGTGVSIVLYAWAEDIQLSGPSIGLALQSGEDEYGDGVISKPASAVATITRSLSDIPIIGKFMTATSVGASAVAKIATMFGFTNEAVISDHKPVTISNVPKFASSEISHPVEKLTLDPKNELSVDPTMFGAPDCDEMAISYIAQKESFLTSATWSTTNALDDILFSSYVTPCLYGNSTDTYPITNMTPMCWLTRCFSHWRGDIIFRFKIVASKFHKGRLRVTYDPYANIDADVNTSTVCFTEVVDISEETNIEVRIPYQQATTFLRRHLATTAATYPYSTAGSAIPATYTVDMYNGRLNVRVLNILTAPLATASIDMMVFVRAAENFELAGPTRPPEGYTLFQVQGGEDELVTQTAIAGNGPSIAPPERYVKHFGENIASIRSLLHRYCLSEMYYEFTNSTSTLVFLRDVMSRIPRYYGYDPRGIHTFKGLIATSTDCPANCTNNTFINWFSPAYVAFKGGVNWTIMTEGQKNTNIYNVSATRLPDVALTYTDIAITLTGSSPTTNSAANYYTHAYCPPTGAGSAITQGRSNPSLNFEMPHYSNYNFQTTDPLIATAPSEGDGSAYDCVSLTMLADCSSNGTGGAVGIKYYKYCATAPDYGLYFFLNVPSYILATMTTAA